MLRRIQRWWREKRYWEKVHAFIASARVEFVHYRPGNRKNGPAFLIVRNRMNGLYLAMTEDGILEWGEQCGIQGAGLFHYR